MSVERFIAYGGRVTHGVAERRPLPMGRGLLLAHCGQSEREHIAARRVPDPRITCKECIRRAALSTPITGEAPND